MARHETIEKYVYRQCKTYKVVQKGKVLGRFKTPEEAIQFKRECLHDGRIKQYPQGRPISKHENRYIQSKKHKSKTSYTIQKVIGGVHYTYGTYYSLEDARSERDFLESIGWDYDNMETMENMEWEQGWRK